jgi:hypothetical protein
LSCYELPTFEFSNDLVIEGGSQTKWQVASGSHSQNPPDRWLPIAKRRRLKRLEKDLKTPANNEPKTSPARVGAEVVG